MNRKEILKWYAEEFVNIHKEIKNKKYLSYSDFLRIRNFKLQNSSREDIKKISKTTEVAFKLAKRDEIEKAISKLQELHGVAIPIASTILAMKFPDKYAIIDRIVITKLGKKEWLEKYLNDSKIYKEYLLLLRKKANQKNTSLREYERSLFES